MKKKTAKRNPQDATRRNVQAANKKLKDLLERVDKLETAAHDLWSASAKIENIELRLLKLEQEHADTPEQETP